jgi:multiple sugar transport system substrate-binding protein
MRLRYAAIGRGDWPAPVRAGEVADAGRVERQTPMNEHVTNVRITRRRILGLSLTAAALGPIAAACGAPAAPTAAPKPTEAPKAAAPTTAPAAPTAAPKPTDVPKPTEAPKAAEQPKPTEAPKPTAAAAATAKPAGPGGAFDWMKFKGDSINVEMSTSPRADMFKKYQKEFEDLTGIKVNLEITPEQQARQKQIIQFQAGATDFDVTFVSWHVQKRLFGKSKWTQDLKPWVTDATKTPAEYDFADIGKAGVDYATQADGRMDTLPMTIDLWMVYWNKELFEKAGLKWATTHDEMYQAAKKITDANNKIYGFIARGLKNANVPVWTQMLLGYDIDPIDRKTGKLNTDGPEAIEAAKLYQKLLRECAPPTVAGYNWNECQTSFMQGGVGMWMDGIGFSTPLSDPTKSKIVGKVGFGVTPKGPKAQHSAIFGDGAGVSSYSKKKEQAYLYVLWATNKANQVRLLTEAGSNPVRMSVFKDPKVTGGTGFAPGFLDLVSQSAAIGRPGLPEIIPVTEFRDTFGIALTNLIGGADPAAELKKATETFKPILDKSEAG